MINTMGPRYHITLFGSGQILNLERKQIPVRSRKMLAVLAYLAIEHAAPHRREFLMGLFWPDLAPADARNNLRVTLARLRKLFAHSPTPVLLIDRQTVQFNGAADLQVDVFAFNAAWNQVHAHANAHDHSSLVNCSPCLAALTAAVERYQAELLQGLHLAECEAFDEWLTVTREHFHLRAVEVLIQLTKAYQAQQSLPQAEATIRRWLALDPLQEEAHRELMRLLVLSGQRNAALLQYARCAQILATELGVEPEVETEQLRQDIEAGAFENRALTDTALTNATLTGAVQNAPAQRLENALPEISTPFIGRERELKQLCRRLAERRYRLISLVGPGGIGKTRLAIQAARTQRNAFRDGVFFVPLEGVQSASEIPAAIAGALGVTFTSDQQSPQREIKQILQAKELLLVIDNLEHVIAEGADLLLEIVQGAAGVVLLVTSREQLNAQAEDLFYLSGLAYPSQESATEMGAGSAADAARYPALRLFTDRAHRINKRFRLSAENLPAVVQICQMVDGLPLGIELAATWMRDYSAPQIAAALTKDFALLKTDLRDMSPRHRNIATVFEHSWQLLTPKEQAALARLGVFRGGFTPSAAGSAAGSMPLTLTRLRYKSLVRDDGAGRYAMHELIRQLALRKLDEDPAMAAATHAAHSRYFLALLREQATHLSGVDAARAGALLRLDLDNIRRAWRWAAANAALADLQASCADLAAFLEHVGLAYEGVQLLQLAIDALPVTADDTHAELLAPLLVKQLLLRNLISPLDENIAIIQRILTVTQGRPALARIEAETYLLWSMAYLYQDSNPVQARVYLNQAIARIERSDGSGNGGINGGTEGAPNDREFAAQLYCESGRNYLHEGRFEDAIQLLEKGLAIFEELGNIRGQALAYSQLAPAYAEAYRLGPALVCDRKALLLYTQVDNQTKLSSAHNNVADTYYLLGAYEQAGEHAVKSLEISRRQGNAVNEANTLGLSAAIMARIGQIEAAERVYRSAIQAQKALRLNFALRFSLLNWGMFQLARGRVAAAEITLREAVELNSDVPHLKVTAQAKLATAFLAQGRRNDEALALAHAVWSAIEPNAGAGLPLPLDTMVECYAVFHACGDPRTAAALHMAHNVLMRTAAEIDDPAMRDAFLNNVPVNVQIRAVSAM